MKNFIDFLYDCGSLDGSGMAIHKEGELRPGKLTIQVNAQLHACAEAAGLRSDKDLEDGFRIVDAEFRVDPGREDEPYWDTVVRTKAGCFSVKFRSTGILQKWHAVC
jgi:hypothetical protein